MTYSRKRPELSPSAYVVLGMIHLGRRSGYEIKQAVELSIRFFWTISHAQIYPALESLEKAGLIRGRNDPRGRLPRRVFTITRAGKAALQAWLRRDESLPYELRDIGLVKLFFADLQERAMARHLVETIGRRSAERVAQLRAIQPVADSLADDEGYSFPRVTLRLGIAYHRALLEECETIGRELSAGAGDDKRTSSARSASARSWLGARHSGGAHVLQTPQDAQLELRAPSKEKTRARRPKVRKS